MRSLRHFVTSESHSRRHIPQERNITQYAVAYPGILFWGGFNKFS